MRLRLGSNEMRGVWRVVELGRNAVEFYEQNLYKMMLFVRGLFVSTF